VPSAFLHRLHKPARRASADAHPNASAQSNPLGPDSCAWHLPRGIPQVRLAGMEAPHAAAVDRPEPCRTPANPVDGGGPRGCVGPDEKFDGPLPTGTWPRRTSAALAQVLRSGGINTTPQALMSVPFRVTWGARQTRLAQEPRLVLTCSSRKGESRQVLWLSRPKQQRSVCGTGAGLGCVRGADVHDQGLLMSRAGMRSPV